METFLLKLAVAVIPLVLLVISVTLVSAVSCRHSRRLLARHRSHRLALRALAHGALLR